MSLPTSGEIRISQIQTLMGGQNPIYISEYFQKIWVEAKNSVQWKGMQNTKQIKDKILG